MTFLLKNTTVIIRNNDIINSKNALFQRVGQTI